MTDAETLAIEHACSRVSVAISMAADRHDADGFAGFFTPDGGFFRRGELVTGRPALAATVKAWSDDLVIRHFIGSTLIEVQDQDHATGITYFTAFRHEGPLNGKGVAPLADINIMAEYHDSFVRMPEGWRISYRKTVPVFAR